MKTATILKNIEANKELQKAIRSNTYYSAEQFINDANRYIKAIRERRVICSIGRVSSSGMSRTIKFLAPEHNKQSKCYNYYNFFALFKTLGYSPENNRSDYFRIHGCGMDMIFYTNYSIIHDLHRLGFINKETCAKLAQMTPTTI